jgi:predicted PurR-regulated permease PerM
MTKQIARIGLAVLTTLLVLLVLWQFRIVVIYVLISLMLAAALRPLANRLVGRRFIIRAAWILLYLVVLGGFGFILYITSGIAISEIQSLAHSVSSQDAWRLPTWLEGSAFQQSLMERLPPPSKLFGAVTGDQGQLVLPTLLGFTQGVGSIVAGILVISFLGIYWGLNQIHFERLWLSLLPSAQRKQARGIWRVVEPDIGAYIRGQVLQSVITGFVLGLGYWLLGSPYAALLALVGALACLIPMVGIALVVIPVLLVGLLSSLQLGLFTALFALVLMIVMGVWIKPRLFHRRWDNPILTLVILIALANAFGLLGIIVAPPLSAVCQILWSRLVSHRRVSGAAEQISDLKARQDHIWETVKAMDEPPPPLVTSSMERLTRLIAKAEPFLQAALPADSSDPFNALPSATTAGMPSASKRPRRSKR